MCHCNNSRINDKNWSKKKAFYKNRLWDFQDQEWKLTRKIKWKTSDDENKLKIENQNGEIK